MAMYYLATNPEAQEKAAAEALEAVAAVGKGEKISGETFSELKYIDNCLSETLRLATVPVTARLVKSNPKVR